MRPCSTCPYFTEETILRLFAEALGWEFLPEISDRQVPPEFVQNVPATYAQHHHLIGIQRPDQDGDGLMVVLSRPLDTNALDNVSKMTQMPVQPAVSTRAAITAVIDTAYQQRTSVIEEVAEELDSQNLDQVGGRGVRLGRPAGRGEPAPGDPAGQRYPVPGPADAGQRRSRSSV